MQNGMWPSRSDSHQATCAATTSVVAMANGMGQSGIGLRCTGCFAFTHSFNILSLAQRAQEKVESSLAPRTRGEGQLRAAKQGEGCVSFGIARGYASTVAPFAPHPPLRAPSPAGRRI